MWCDIVSKTKSSTCSLKPFYMYFAFLYLDLFCFVLYSIDNWMCYGLVTYFTYFCFVLKQKSVINVVLLK